MAKQHKTTIIGVGLIFLEVSLLFALFSFLPVTQVFAGIGEPNITVPTWLEVGNNFPFVLNVSIDNDAAAVALSPNATTLVSCVAVIRDYNGDSDISTVNATFYDSVSSSHGDTDDNNLHYTNSSCNITADTGNFNGYADDEYHSLANCSFYVEYYANPEDWVCNVTVADNSSWEGTNSDTITISQLLALGLPNIINYSTVNSTFVSDEIIANVTNLGNVQINLSLEGYARTQNDGYAMNCSLGNIENITIDYEKYDLNESTPAPMSLTVFEANYTNLTTSAVIKTFELNYRQNESFNEAVSSTYWRIYVPLGVAGTCEGNIIFGATTAAGN